MDKIRNVEITIHNIIYSATFVTEGTMGFQLEQVVIIAGQEMDFIPAEYLDYSWFRDAVKDFKIDWKNVKSDFDLVEKKEIKNEYKKSRVYTV